MNEMFYATKDVWLGDDLMVMLEKDGVKRAETVNLYLALVRCGFYEWSAKKGRIKMEVC